jgi:SNF2 family DNA or RNA helicase
MAISFAQLLTPEQIKLILSQRLLGTLFEHQADQIERQITGPDMLLAGDPGTGKTLVAIAQSLLVTAAITQPGWPYGWRPSIYAMPANLVRQTHREFAKFAPSLRVVVLRTGKDRPPAPGSYDLILTSYTLPVVSKPVAEMLGKLAPFASVIYDESHQLRNVKAKRTGLWVGLSRGANWILPMSGTPYVNSGEDLYVSLGLLKLLKTPGIGIAQPGGAPRIASFREFCANFVFYKEMTIKGHTFTKATGVKNPEILNAALSPRTTRWVASELLSLPPLLHELHMLDEGDVLKQLSPEDRESLKALMALFELFKQLKGNTDPAEIGRLLVMIEAAIAEAGTDSMSTYRRLIGTAKAPLVAEYVAGRIEAGGGQTLIFGHHRATLQLIKDALDKAEISNALLYGGVSQGARDKAVQAFQAGELKTLVLQIEVAGLGLNLQAASHVVFAELPWTDAAYRQAIARSHRAGQDQHVLVSVATVPDSIDEMLAFAIQRKVVEAASVIDDVFDRDYEPARSL